MMNPPVVKPKPVRVRFAPSPTGPLNIGGVRTALFNWLFAKHKGGSFLLRIEDTDRERSKKEYEESIKDSLAWLGLLWDEFHRQTDRIDRYAFHLQKLIDEDKVYHCFCTEEELEHERGAQLSQGIPPIYSGHCRGLAKEERDERLKTERAVLRLKVPEKEISFHDLIRGKVNFDAKLIGDFIIAKSLQEPLYNFAVVVDDFEMQISHVVRGEEHIANTPRQILIQEALGFEGLTYAHLPLILGPDRKKLSKRDLAKSLLDYRDEGYLPNAILNFLVLLGWHPREDREVISLEEMTKEFSFDRVQKGGALFNPEKLGWLNGTYIRGLDDEILVRMLLPFVPKAWSSDSEFLKKIVSAEKERLKTLAEFQDRAKFFFTLPEYDASVLIWKKATKKETKENLREVHEMFGKLSDNDFGEKAKEVLMPYAELKGRGAVLWPLRVALSGKSASPGPFELIEILGKKETLQRISQAFEKFTA